MEAMESILDSVKKAIGILPDYTEFDPEIIMHINSALSILTQLGVGPTDGFMISDNSTTWTEFVGEDKRLDMVRTYVCMKVRLMFDPPSSSFVLESMNKQIAEFEWRLNVAVETPAFGGEGV